MNPPPGSTGQCAARSSACSKKLKQDWSLLIVTHDAGDLTELADRAWTLDHGVLSPYALDTPVQLTA